MNQIYQDPDLYFLRDKPFLGFEPPAWLRVTDGRFKEAPQSNGRKQVDEAWAEREAELKRLKAQKKAAEREELRQALWAAKSAEKAAKAEHLATLREEASRKFQLQREEALARKEAQKKAKADAQRKTLVAEQATFQPVTVVPKEARSRTEYWREYARTHKQKGTGEQGRTFAVAVVYMWPDGSLEHFASMSALAKAIGKTRMAVATAMKERCGMFADGGMVRVKG